MQLAVRGPLLIRAIAAHVVADLADDVLQCLLRDSPVQQGNVEIGLDPEGVAADVPEVLDRLGKLVNLRLHHPLRFRFRLRSAGGLAVDHYRGIFHPRVSPDQVNATDDFDRKILWLEFKGPFDSDRLNGWRDESVVVPHQPDPVCASTIDQAPRLSRVPNQRTSVTYIKFTDATFEVDFFLEVVGEVLHHV